MTWQDFAGTILQEEKEVIAIAGTHGKTTITALVGLILEAAGQDPTVLVGGVVPVGKAMFGLELLPILWAKRTSTTITIFTTHPVWS